MLKEILMLTWKKIFRVNWIQSILVAFTLGLCLYFILFTGNPSEGVNKFGSLFGLLAVLLSGGLVFDEFDSRQIDPLLSRKKKAVFFWGKYLAVWLLVVGAFFLLLICSLLSLEIKAQIAIFPDILEGLVHGLLVSTYYFALGFLFACFLRGAMNFAAVLLLQVATVVIYIYKGWAEELLKSGQLISVNPKSLVALAFVPEWITLKSWHVAYALFLTAVFLLASFALFKSKGLRNNLIPQNTEKNSYLLRLKDLRKTFREGPLTRQKKEALSGVNFSIKAGRLTGFLGPNGAGKTTTIRIILGFLKPDSGQIEYYSKAERGGTSASLNIGYMQENASLYPFLSVREIFELVARNDGLSRAEAGEKSLEMASMLNLNEYLDSRIKSLSKGTRQKVALGVAVIGQPDFLIFDEPYTGLDPIIMHEVRNLILELRARGITIFLSSHLLPEVERVCEEIVLINKGKIICGGEIDRLKTSWQIFQAIKGNPELGRKLGQLIGEELNGKSFNYLAGLHLENLLQDEKLRNELETIPVPDVEKIFLESVVNASGDEQVISSDF
ncbi:MAG TPA: ATP-binding cassette domain-containing protein [Candidatus Saccharicenans sp.]|nr:ATP-binding cassette domain-containing protein [Candidatus Saccharicenans sp.]HRD01432.1 ATP-binding cassette domain-containing protein [Candidatus Saccharicenans sp.]